MINTNTKFFSKIIDKYKIPKTIKFDTKANTISILGFLGYLTKMKTICALVS